MKKLKRSLKISLIDLYDALKTEKLINHSKVQLFSDLEVAIFLFFLVLYLFTIKR